MKTLSSNLESVSISASAHGYNSGSRKRGSALVAVLIFAIVLSLVGGSAVNYINQERQASARTVVRASLLHVAEAGLARGIWAINNKDWDGWKDIYNNSDKYLERTTVDLDNSSILTQYQVVVVDAGGAEPLIYSEAEATMPNGQVVRRQLRIAYLSGTTSAPETISGPTGGLIGKNYLIFKGYADAYDSSKGPWDLNFNRLDQVIVGSVNRGNQVEMKSDAEIWGYVATGGGQPSIEGGMRLWGEDSAENGDWKGSVDRNRISTDLTYDFPEVEQPSWNGARRSAPEAKGNVVLGSYGQTTRYRLKELKFDDGGFEIRGDVQIYVEDGISMSGDKHYFLVEDGNSLEVYTPKDISISGQAIVNETGQPANVRFFGTNTKPKDQKFNYSGQGEVTAVVYMPYGLVDFSGQVVLSGSAIGYEVYVEINDGGSFHYDVRLGSDVDDSGELEDTGDGQVLSWHELVKNEHRLHKGLGLAAYAQDGT